MAKPRAPRGAKSLKNDSVMATNNSSIVSKRSVERLYHSEPHFFRYFVNKPQRRSPLINRGYALRMQAVEDVVRRFLDELVGMRKVVVNLGCGYDPLPFQWLSKDATRCDNVTFVDIDYPELITKKCEIITNTPQLWNVLHNPIQCTESDGLSLQSEEYLALGCDLRDITKLEAKLVEKLDVAHCLILFIAEVSIVYTNVDAADALIAWAARYENVRFCLLEQFLPNGSEHPFAKTMIKHFDKLKTPLKSIEKYPQLLDQERRFTNAGWTTSTARSLWELWIDPSFLSLQKRQAMDKVEPFDEWEEFTLFASHYFLLVAVKGRRDAVMFGSHSKFSIVLNPGPPPERIDPPTPSFSGHVSTNQFGNQQRERRFGAIYSIGTETLIHHGGYGAQRRLNSANVYTRGNREIAAPNAFIPSPNIGVRMCHTITELGDDKSLLVGGRTSPDHALSDCWLRKGTVWEPTDNLPVPLYRQCAAKVLLRANETGILVFGGKSSKGIPMSNWFLWRGSTGWAEVQSRDKTISRRFGAAMECTGPRYGLVLGGMTEIGLVCNDIWFWELEEVNSRYQVQLSDCTSEIYRLPPTIQHSIYRFGACLTWSRAGLILIGGIASQGIIPTHLNILGLIHETTGHVDSGSLHLAPVPLVWDGDCSDLLLIGHSVGGGPDSLAIAGGGAVCFSFGTYWNKAISSLQFGDAQNENVWRCNLQNDPEPGVTRQMALSNLGSLDEKFVHEQERGPRGVPTIRLESSVQLERIVRRSKPVVFDGLDLGHCTKEWTLESLMTKIGRDRSVVVHEARTHHMSFQEKNFDYVIKPFGSFVDEIITGSRQYLRSISSVEPSERPTELTIDFPGLARDFRLPPQLDYVTRNAHSSPLRISSDVAMWLHYDVMANILCQIQGAKRLILYPPSDVSHLGISPGASSSHYNVFDLGAAGQHSLKFAHPREVLLQPGQVLFIPPLWSHTASPTEGISIAVNVFFRDLEQGYAAGKDVYGNRDVQAYEKGRKDIKKIVRGFDRLPTDMARFYLDRLADELKTQVQAYGTSEG